jgi:hypothetical protein
MGSDDGYLRLWPLDFEHVYLEAGMYYDSHFVILILVQLDFSILNTDFSNSMDNVKVLRKSPPLTVYAIYP